MTVTSVHKDPATRRMTIVTELAAPVGRVWQLWADPRQLERWWGPPTYPATFVDHDLTPGGTVTYFMTGPDSSKHRGWWRVLAVEPPRYLQVEDGFADETGAPSTDMPVSTMSVTLAALPDGRTRMSMETTFPTLEAMEQLVEMGMEEGITMALNQIDALL